jgi:hypothetical protein
MINFLLCRNLVTDLSSVIMSQCHGTRAHLSGVLHKSLPHICFLHRTFCYVLMPVDGSLARSKRVPLPGLRGFVSGFPLWPAGICGWRMFLVVGQFLLEHFGLSCQFLFHQMLKFSYLSSTAGTICGLGTKNWAPSHPKVHVRIVVR